MIEVNRLNKILLALAIVFSVLLFNGCKSKKIVSSENAELENKTHTKVIDDVLNTEIQYNSIYSKGSISLNGSMKLPAVYKLIKDSILQASVRIPFIGGEAMRMTITPDSIIIIDRRNKQYVAEDFRNSALAKSFDFNFYNLQALFTNKLFLPGKKNVAKSEYNKMDISATQTIYMLQTKDKNNMKYTFAVDASNHIVSTLIYNGSKNITLEWTYSDFIEDAGRTYPTSIMAKADIAKKRLNLGFVFDKLEIDKDFDIDNSVSSKYKKVSILELIETYIKLK